MNTTWQARAEGYFFPRENLSAAIQSKLQMLILEDAAQIFDGGTLIPFEKSFLLSEEDAELLKLPPLNPYQISIRTEGYIGGKNFRYVTEFLEADGRKILKPQIKGALLHVDENIFRLNASQFALINLVKLGNENLSRKSFTRGAVAYSQKNSAAGGRGSSRSRQIHFRKKNHRAR